MTNQEILPGFTAGQRVHLIDDRGYCLVTGRLYLEPTTGHRWAMVDGFAVAEDGRPYGGRKIVDATY